MRVLIGFERSGVFRRAFREAGFDAWSCDLVPADDGSPHHFTGDAFEVLKQDWDLAVLHPSCTRLTNAGARWLTKPPPGKTLDDMWDALMDGAADFRRCLEQDHIPLLAVENPVMHKHARALISEPPDPSRAGRVDGRPSFTVQPWQFATDEKGPDNVKKRTCFWTRGLPPLLPTGPLDGSTARPDVHHASPGPDRARLRAQSFPGMAAAAAKQWGDVLRKRLEEES